MAADFEELAARAKAAHEARRKEQEKEGDERRAARSRAIDAGIAQLKSEVLPGLQKAAAAMRHTGIDVRIKEKLDEANIHTHPTIVFQCFGPRRASDGWQFEGIPAFFESDGQTVSAGLADYAGAAFPKHQVGTAPPKNYKSLVGEVVQKLLDSYYAEVEKHGL